jgi:hypothetical protein
MTTTDDAMQDDVIKVARAIFESDGQSWSEVGTAKSWYLDAARAAMAATREIDAEALRKPAIGFVDHLDVATCAEAVGLIEAQAAEIERLQEAIAGPNAWLDSWAQHVGNCQGGYVCTCGLTRARSELSAAIAAAKGE